MTDDELAAFIAAQQAIEDARTPGKWHYNRKQGEVQTDDGNPVLQCDMWKLASILVDDDDAAFIEAVTAHYGRLLSELERLRIENAEQKKVLHALEIRGPIVE